MFGVSRTEKAFFARTVVIATSSLALFASVFAEPNLQGATPDQLQKALWGEQELAAGVDNEPPSVRKNEYTSGQPDCRKPPEFPGENKAVLFPPGATAIPGSIRAVVPRGGEKLIALTFDLCEMAGQRSGYDFGIVKYLRQSGVKATFFASGKWMCSHHEKTLQLMADPLFEIGNHGWTHRNMRRLNQKEAEREVLWTQAQYVEMRKDLERRADRSGLPMPAIAVVPPVYRFPFGSCTDENLKLMEKFKLPVVQWNIVTGDPSPAQSAPAIARVVLGQAKPGAIIVAHANGRGRHTAESLPLFIPQLRQQGYRFVTVTELLRSAERVDVAKTCYELKPGDIGRYDRQGP